MDGMSAYLNMVEGSKQLEMERKMRESYIRNEEEKSAREMIEQQEKADASPEEEQVTQEELQQQLEALQKAITDVTSKIKGDA